MIEITFLGTGCMVPTKERNVSGIYLQYKTKGLLFDCGEGTQRQMNIAGINRNKVTHVFITHWHGDHVSGLVGLIQTIGNQQFQNEEAPTLHIYGPKETEMRIEHLMQTCIFENKVNLEVHELLPKRNDMPLIVDTDDFAIQATLVDHTVPCLAYAFIEKDIRKMDEKKLASLGIKGPAVGTLQQGLSIIHDGKEVIADDVSSIKPGKRIVFVLDTGVCDAAIALAKQADLLICEASFASTLDEKAENNKHLTAKQAALIANNAQVKKLILTHISQRYKTPHDIIEDAKDLFDNVDIAYDFMKVKL